MKTLFLCLAIFSIPLMAAKPISAQVQTFFLVDQLETVDAQAIEMASAPLLDRAAKVAVLITEDRDTIAHLESEGLMIGTIVDPVLIALHVNSADNTAEIVLGSRWEFEFRNFVDEVKTDLQTSLESQDYTRAIIDALDQIEDYLSGELTNESSSTSATVVEEADLMPWWVYVFGGTVGLIGLAFLMTIYEMRFTKE